MRYFFHRLDGGCDLDTEGMECADLKMARREAVLYAAGTMRDNPEYVWKGGELRVEVMDERGALATTVVVMSIDSSDPAAMIRNACRDDEDQS